MKKLAITLITAGGLVGSVLMAPQASAVPRGPDSVEETVRSLEAKGHKVILNKVGPARLSQCRVDRVRPGRDATVYLDADCSDRTSQNRSGDGTSRNQSRSSTK